MILNGKSVGGFDEIIDNSDMSDGIMNIIIIKNIENLFAILQIFLDLINNNLINNDYVRTLTARSYVVEKVKEEIDVSIDGEEGKNEKVEIKFIGNRFKIFRK